jgi:hypothetical protein
VPTLNESKRKPRRELLRSRRETLRRFQWLRGTATLRRIACVLFGILAIPNRTPGQEPAALPAATPHIRLKRIESTDLSKVGYNRATRILKVRFHDGRIYEFFGVPESIHKRLIGAESKGRFFHDTIRYRFAYRKVSD